MRCILPQYHLEGEPELECTLMLRIVKDLVNRKFTQLGVREYSSNSGSSLNSANNHLHDFGQGT